jgi:hypothetical protein
MLNYLHIPVFAKNFQILYVAMYIIPFEIQWLVVVSIPMLQ